MRSVSPTKSTKDYYKKSRKIIENKDWKKFGGLEMEESLKDEIRKKAQTWAENKTREWEKRFPPNL